MEFSGFTAIEAASAFELEISQGETYSVEVDVDERLRDAVRISQEGGTLHIGMEPFRALWPFGQGKRRVRISLPVLEAIELSGATRATAGDFKSDHDFRASLSGASRLQARIEAAAVSLDASGASHCTLRGAGTKVALDASGASRLELAEFTAPDATVELSGASSAAVRATEQLAYNISGASRLSYAGGPRIARGQSTGASSTSTL